MTVCLSRSFVSLSVCQVAHHSLGNVRAERNAVITPLTTKQARVVRRPVTCFIKPWLVYVDNRVIVMDN